MPGSAATCGDMLGFSKAPLNYWIPQADTQFDRRAAFPETCKHPPEHSTFARSIPSDQPALPSRNSNGISFRCAESSLGKNAALFAVLQPPQNCQHHRRRKLRTESRRKQILANLHQPCDRIVIRMPLCQHRAEPLRAGRAPPTLSEPRQGVLREPQPAIPLLRLQAQWCAANRVRWPGQTTPASALRF